MTARIGNYMSTYTGQKYWPLDPRADEVSIENIAHHLAMQCRWNGATKKFLSVAEHSFWVSMFEPHLDPLEKLLHDAPEFAIGDMIRPMKHDPVFHGPFTRIEDLNERVIAERFGLQYPLPSSVKRADEAVCSAEWRQAINKDPADDWEVKMLHDDTVVAPITIEFWEPELAKRMFLARFKTLWAAKEQRLREMQAFNDVAMSA